MARRRTKKQSTAIPAVEQFLKKIELLDRDNLPEQFHLFDERSAQAIRAALAARRPLLVRGEPGVGKTQLAEAAAKVLGRPLVRQVVDSRTESRDLLWTFDALMRLADAQVAAALSPGIRAAKETEEGTVVAEIPESLKQKLRAQLDVENYVRPGPLWWAFDWGDAKKQAVRSDTPEPVLDEGADPDKGTVVLIDEIDKADADVPNGLLEALGSGRFTPLGRRKPVEIVGQPPLVVITTNEERVLPSAFVRRCLVLPMALDRDQDLARQLVARAGVHFADHANDYAELFQKAAEMLVAERIAARGRLVTPLPGQAEYLDLVRAVLNLEEGSGRDPLQILDSVASFALKKESEPRP